jgi:hypothetical protein
VSFVPALFTGRLGLVLATCFAILISVTGLANPSAGEDVNPDSAIAKSLVRKSVIGKIRDKVASLDVKVDVPLLEARAFEHVNTALKYRYEFEPSYQGDYHLRMDRWKLTNDINIGDMIKGEKNFKFGLDLKHGTEVLFVRAFKDRKDAIRAMPYPFWNLPFNAEDISEKLEIGDFVSFNANMNLIVGASTLPFSVNPISIWTHFIISGEFQIHLFRKSENHTILKIIAVRKKHKDFGWTAGFAAGQKIFGLKVVDRRVERWANVTEIFSASFSQTKSNLLMIDYTMDTRDERVRKAYDGLITSLYEFNTAEISNPFASNDELAGRLLSDVTAFESIYSTERLKPNLDRTLERNFKGRNDIQENPRSNFRFGAMLFRFSRDSEYTENALTSIDTNEVPNYFRLHTFQRRNTTSWWFSYFKSESISRASLLFEADSNLKIRSIRDIVFEWDYRDKQLENDEFSMIKNAVRQAVPGSVHGKLNWGEWDGSRNYQNARFLYRMVLSPMALSSVRNFSSDEVYQLLVKYIPTIPAPSADSIDPFRTDPDYMALKTTVVEKYQFDLLNIAHWLNKVFDTTSSHEDRAKAFAELRFNHLFVEIGPGFLVSLLPIGDLQNYVYFNVSLTGDEMKPMNFEYGKVPDRKLYEAASYIRSVLDSRDTDIAIQLNR